MSETEPLHLGASLLKGRAGAQEGWCISPADGGTPCADDFLINDYETTKGCPAHRRHVDQTECHGRHGTERLPAGRAQHGGPPDCPGLGLVKGLRGNEEKCPIPMFFLQRVFDIVPTKRVGSV